MYRPNQCTEAHCTKARVGEGKCAGHLFRWALHCRHLSHDHALAA